MRTTARLFGHSIHPILITLPLGAFIASVIFDIVYLATGTLLWGEVSLWNMGLGILGAFVAAVPGFIDWLRLPRGTRARQVGTTHMMVQLLGTMAFVINWLIRYNSPSVRVSAGQFILSLCALFLLALGGWLGGELVERLGIGVWEDARPDAPSSLRRERRVLGDFRPTEPRPI